MTVCTICGKLLKDSTPVCPNGHKILANITIYLKELQRAGAVITLTTENGLTSGGHIQMVTEKGFYLYDSTVVADPLFFTWDEIDTITPGKTSV